MVNLLDNAFYKIELHHINWNASKLEMSALTWE